MVARILPIVGACLLLLPCAQDTAAQQPRSSSSPSARVTGSCVVLLDLDEASGKVVRVRIVKSTGSRILDDSAIKAFSKWHFKPHTPSPVRVPMTFSLRGDKS